MAYKHPTSSSEYNSYRNLLAAPFLMASIGSSTVVLEESPAASPPPQRRRHPILLAFSYAALVLGSVASTILSRFYFAHGGGNRWLVTLLQSVGFPLLLFFIYATPWSSSSPPFSQLTRKILLVSLFMGLLTGISNILFSFSSSLLPVSTSSLLLSTQLAFTLLLSAIIAGVPLSFANLNAVVLLTLSSLLLSLRSSDQATSSEEAVSFFGDRAQYALGVAATLGAALLFAVYLPAAEVMYRLVSSFRMVLEMQVLIQAVATVIAVSGYATWRTRDEGWMLGEGAYWSFIAASVVSWQLSFLGTAGTVYAMSSLHGGVCMTALLSANVIGGVVVFGDVFGAEKAVAMALCLWAFGSYIQGEYGKKDLMVLAAEDDDERKIRMKLANGDVDV